MKSVLAKLETRVNCGSVFFTNSVLDNHMWNLDNTIDLSARLNLRDVVFHASPTSAMLKVSLRASL